MTKVRIPLRATSPVIRAVVRKGKPKWTATRRLRVALVNNNQGTWWCCRSRITVADIERRFIEGSVASLLYKVVGGVLGDHKMLSASSRSFYLYMQLARRDGDVDFTLRELGLQPVAPIAFSDIRWP